MLHMLNTIQSLSSHHKTRQNYFCQNLGKFLSLPLFWSCLSLSHWRCNCLQTCSLLCMWLKMRQHFMFCMCEVVHAISGAPSNAAFLLQFVFCLVSQLIIRRNRKIWITCIFVSYPFLFRMSRSVIDYASSGTFSECKRSSGIEYRTRNF